MFDPGCPGKKVLSGWTPEGEFKSIDIRCGSQRVTILDSHPFTEDSGYDPDLIRVKCKDCGTEYYWLRTRLSGSQPGDTGNIKPVDSLR